LTRGVLKPQSNIAVRYLFVELVVVGRTCSWRV